MGEFVKQEFDAYLSKHGIQHQKTVPYTPQQNGVAERKNKTLVEMARCMLYSKGLHKKFWAEAICCANFILNTVPTKVVKNVTPKEKWNGRNLDISNFKVFGCECWAHIPDEKRKKLEPKSHKCIFIGYDENSKAYRLFDPSSQSFIIRTDVQFHEVSSRPESVESHITLNLPIPLVTPNPVTPFFSYVPLIDVYSSSP